MSGPALPWTLAFELSNPTSGGPDASSIALGRGAEVAATEHVRPALPRSAEDDLFPAIRRLLERAGIGVGDLRGGRMAVSVGPGGYTGLRVACAAAKVLAETVGGMCVPVPTALVALRALRSTDLKVSGTRAAVALASKSDSAWVYVEGDEDATAARFIHAGNVGEALGERGVSVLIADAHLPGAIREACAGIGVDVVSPALSAAGCLEVAAGLGAVDPALLVPVYAREPDAVTLWKRRT